MTTYLRHLVHHGPVLQGLGKTFMAARNQPRELTGQTAPNTPGPEVSSRLPARPPQLIADFVRHIGGNPKAYRDTVPPHLFPQWTFGLASQLMLPLPYPLMRIVNGGCRLEVHAPMPQGEPIDVTAQLENVDDNGRRAVITQKLVCGTNSAPAAMEARIYAIAPLQSKSTNGSSSGAQKTHTKKPKARVPMEARELAEWRLRSNAGLEFAALTGDFNPIHWIPSVARANGFKGTILHGFATMARAIEGIKTHYLLGGGRLRWVDVQFTRPLVLPGTVKLFVHSTNDEHQVFVGDAPGGPAYMTGTFEVSSDPEVGM